MLNEVLCVSLNILKYKFYRDAGIVKNGHCPTVQLDSGQGFNPSPSGKMESYLQACSPVAFLVPQWSGKSWRAVLKGRVIQHSCCSHHSTWKRVFHCKFSTLEQMTCFVLGDWYEQLYPLVITLKDCMGEVVTRAKQSMAFVLLQELACGLPQCLMLTLRRDIVFSQAVGCLLYVAVIISILFMPVFMVSFFVAFFPI